MEETVLTQQGSHCRSFGSTGKSRGWRGYRTLILEASARKRRPRRRRASYPRRDQAEGSWWWWSQGYFWVRVPSRDSVLTTFCGDPPPRLSRITSTSGFKKRGGGVFQCTSFTTYIFQNGQVYFYDNKITDPIQGKNIKTLYLPHYKYGELFTKMAKKCRGGFKIHFWFVCFFSELH